MIDVAEFREKFPAFANPVLYPTDSILLMADMVDCYIDVGNRWFRCVKCQELMTELLTAHLLMINGTPAAPASGATGIISNATVGSVKANPIPLAIAVIPGGEDDKNLAVVFEANRAARGKRPAKDTITIVGTYPNGSTITLTPGIIFDGLPGNAVASAGRMKSKVYNFRFEGMSRVEV